MFQNAIKSLKIHFSTNYDNFLQKMREFWWTTYDDNMKEG